MEITRFLLDRIAKLNRELNAYITVSEEIAIQQATHAEAELCLKIGKKNRRDRGPQQGIPNSLKDKN